MAKKRKVRSGKNGTKTAQFYRWIKRQMVDGKLHFGGPEANLAAKKLSLHNGSSAYGMLRVLEKSGRIKTKKGVRGQGIKVTLVSVEPRAARTPKPKKRDARKKAATRKPRKHQLSVSELIDVLKAEVEHEKIVTQDKQNFVNLLVAASESR